MIKFNNDYYVNNNSNISSSNSNNNNSNNDNNSNSSSNAQVCQPMLATYQARPNLALNANLH